MKGYDRLRPPPPNLRPTSTGVFGVYWVIGMDKLTTSGPYLPVRPERVEGRRRTRRTGVHPTIPAEAGIQGARDSGK